jgi:putative spermidine/putrescine transport system substrate-binding protein
VQVDDSVKEQLVRQDLVQPVDLAKIPNVKNVFPEILDRPELGPAFMIIPIGIGFNTEKFKELGLAEPTSWDIMWEPKLAGRVAIPDLNVVMGVHTLMAAAVRASRDPYNYEAGIQELKKIKLNHIYSSPVDIQTQITNGTVWVVPITEGRINDLRFKGFPVRYANALTSGKKGSLDIDTIHVVKGSKRKDLGEVYINMLLDAGAQLAFARAEGWTPAVRPATESIQKDAALREKFSILDEAGVRAAMRADWVVLNKNWNDIVSKWNRTLKQ